MGLRCDQIGTGLFTAQDLFPDRSKSRSAASSKLAASGVSNIELAGADLR